MGAQKSTPKLGEASLDDNEQPLGSSTPRGPRAHELGEASLRDNEHPLGSSTPVQDEVGTSRVQRDSAHEQAWFPQKSTPNLVSPALKRPKIRELSHHLTTTVLDEVSYACYTGDNLI